MTIVPTVAFLEAIDGDTLGKNSSWPLLGPHDAHQFAPYPFHPFHPFHRHNEFAHDRKTKEIDRKTNWKKWTSRMKFQSKTVETEDSRRYCIRERLAAPPTSIGVA
ncbi:unnamed protein product [Caenorhabditis nigoni]